MQELFNQLDKNGNKTLDQSEVSQGLERVGILAAPSELQDYFRQIDKDQNGVIDYHEFSSFLIQKLKEEMLSMEEFQSNIRREFKKVDVNKTRMLSRMQLATLFHNLEYELQQQELDNLFSEIDRDQNGAIDIDELIYFLSGKKRDISETAKMAVLNINCAHISINDLTATFEQLPQGFVLSFIRKLNKQGLNLPACTLKLQLDNTRLCYKHLFYAFPSGANSTYFSQGKPLGMSALRRTTDSESFEIRINQLTGVPIPDKKSIILGRELKFCLMDSISNFVANTAKVKVYWNQQYEDRWQFQPPNTQNQQLPFFETPIKDENSIIVRISNQQLQTISKLIIELVIYIKNRNKIITISCGWIEIIINDLLTQNRITFELPIQSGIPANFKSLSNVKVERKGWQKFVQKLSSPIKSQISLEIVKSSKFPNEQKDMINCLPPTILLNKIHLSYFAFYREYLGIKMLEPQYRKGDMTLHKSPKIKAFIMGVNSPDFLEFVVRFWLKMESSQQFRELSKQNEELFRMKIKFFEAIQDQSYLLMNNLAYKYHFSDPTYPTHYDPIIKNRNSLYNDFVQTVPLLLMPQRTGQNPIKKEWYNNLEPFNTQQLSDDEDDNILLQKFKNKVQKQKQEIQQNVNQPKINENQFNQ